MNSSHTKQAPVRGRARRFTLVELLAAMAVLVVMMFLLFRFIAGAQRAWSAATSSQEVYEKSRIALDLITRDLQSAVARADDVPGANIRFQQVGPDAMRFVSDGVIGAEGANSQLVEVGYKLSSNVLRRAYENSGCANWNIYQDRSGPETCINNQNGFQEVIDGVLGLQFICYNDALAPVPQWIGTYGGCQIETGVPYAVDVRMRIMDGKSFNRWQLLSGPERSRLESEVALTFSKMIFLGGRQ